MDKQIVEIAEQYAIYDGKPRFPPIGMLMSMLNYYSEGGTSADLLSAIQMGMQNAKRYKTRIIVEIEECAQ